MESNELLGLDVGSVRTGIARASVMARLSEPLMSVRTDNIFDCLEKLIKDNSVGTLVVGLPRSLNGDDTDQTRWVREWVANAKAQIKLPFFWQDEALTSVGAEAEGSKDGHDVDAHAAATILQDFLDSPEDARQPC